MKDRNAIAGLKASQTGLFWTESDGSCKRRYLCAGRQSFLSVYCADEYAACEVAGVGEIVMATPAGADGKVNPVTLVAAHEAGADIIYKVGGAQASQRWLMGRNP